MAAGAEISRPISRVIDGLPTSDGAGVQLLRIIGQPALPMIDPFLLLDAFRSDRADEYVAGFPSHPHRGFETMTYLLAGRIRHHDSAGNGGVIEAGGVQWMTAGRGIVHSEMPEQRDGLLAGLQLWINLPGANKMDPPAYQEYAAEDIPTERRDGAELRVLAGATAAGTRGPVDQPLTRPKVLDVSLAAGSRFREPVDAGLNGFVFVIDGAIAASDLDDDEVIVALDQLGILALGDILELVAGEHGARFLLVAGRPLREPVARAGPFVMNTRAELRQAEQDLADGEF